MCRRECPGQLEGHSTAAQLAEGIGRIGALGIDDRHAAGERAFLRLVVVGNHHIDTQAGELLDPLVRAGTGVDAHDQGGARFTHFLERVRTECIPVLVAIGDVPAHLRTHETQGLDEDRRARHTIHVIVAMD